MANLLDNLQAAYKFEDLTDSFDGFDLSNHNGVTFSAGKLNNCAVFASASSQYLSLVNTTDNALFSFGDSDFTFAGWVNLTDKVAQQTLFGKWDRDANAREYVLQYAPGTDRFAWFVSGDGTASTSVSANSFGSPTAGVWYFVVVWHDSVANTINIQVNNGTVDSAAHSTGVYTGGADFLFGVRDDTVLNYMNGKLDAWNAWRRVLTAAERTALYNAGAGLGFAFGITDNRLYVDWGGDGHFFSTGEDVSDRVWIDSALACSRGKDQIQTLAPPIAGRFSCELDNRSKDYSIANTASPLNGKLFPGKLLRFKMFRNGTAYNVWTGMLDDLPQMPEFSIKRVGLPSLGTFTRLTEKVVSTALYENITTDQAIGYLLDAAGWPAADRVLQTGKTVLAQWWLQDANAFSAMIELLQTEGPGAAIYEDSRGRLVFENRHQRYTQTRSTTSQYTFGTTTNIIAGQPDTGRRNVFNECELTVVERETQPLSVIWQYGAQITFAPNETKTFVVKPSGSDPFKNAQVPSATNGTNEVQEIKMIGAPVSGSFRLGYKGQVSPTNLGGAANGTTTQAALELILGAGNVSVVGSGIDVAPLYVTFQGTLGQMDVDLLTWYADFSKTATTQGVIGSSPFDVFAALTGDVNNYRLKFNDAVGDLAALQDDINSLKRRDAGDTTAPGIYITEIIKGVPADFTVGSGSISSVSLDRTSGQSCTLTMTAGASGAIINGLQVKAQLVTVARTHQITHQIDTTTSKNLYGRRTYKPTIRQEVDKGFAQDYANAAVGLYQNPRITVPVTVEGIDETILAQQLGREISDRVTVVDSQTGLNDGFFIEQIAQHLDPNLVLRTTLGLEKAPTVDVGVWDSGTWDGSVWGY